MAQRSSFSLAGIPSAQSSGAIGGSSQKLPNWLSARYGPLHRRDAHRRSGRARGRLRGAKTLSGDAIRLAERLDDARCLIWAATLAGRVGIQGDGLPYANRAVRVARERALVSTLPYALQAQAAHLLGGSRFDLSYSSAEEGRRLALDIGQPWIASLNVAHLSFIDALRGAEELVRARVTEQQALVAGSGPSRITAKVAYAYGVLDLGLP
jgi:hypothetical protein